jgi:hypothetical protein
MASFDDVSAQLGGMDPFDVPTPGESLTSNPESAAPYEQPPEHADLDDAVHDIFMRLTSEDTMDQFLDLMRDEVPVENIAQVVLFEGFRQGMFNPDLMLLLLEPTIYIPLYLADYANINNVVLYPEGQEGQLSVSRAARTASKGLEEGEVEEGGEEIKVGGKVVPRPESVPTSLLESITQKGGE